MRTVMLVVALAAVCTASPALAQALILSVQGQAQPPAAQTQAPSATKTPAPPSVAQTQTPPPATKTPAPPPVAQTQTPPLATKTPAPPVAKTQAAPAAAPAPAQAQTQSKKPDADQAKGQGESQAKRQDRVPPGAPSRYGFVHLDNGLLRLDHQSGEVSYCTSQTVGWSCAVVTENHRSLKREIAQLRDEIAELKKEVAALREPPPPRPPAPIPPPAAAPPQGAAPPPVAAPENNRIIKLPSQQDIARARAFFAETWRRLVDMISQFQKEMMGRRDTGGNGLSRT